MCMMPPLYLTERKEQHHKALPFRAKRSGSGTTGEGIWMRSRNGGGKHVHPSPPADQLLYQPFHTHPSIKNEQPFFYRTTLWHSSGRR
jgi:hypothetical protein